MVVHPSIRLGAILLALFPVTLAQSIFTINDERVMNIDITPVLGRGYSIMTNSYQSTCLMVDQATVPTFNYKYDYTEISSESEIEAATGVSTAGAFAGGIRYGPVAVFASAAWSASASSSTKVNLNTHMVLSTMRIERYYSSVREEVSPLSPDARALIDSQDYVGFFKACGPNYVRGIRRVQEVASAFTFQATSAEIAAEFSSAIVTAAAVFTPVGGGYQSFAAQNSAKSKFKSSSKSLQISINAWGVGLTAEGSESFVATTLNDFQEVMKFAFRSMTKNVDAHNIGMVYGIEVLPWTHNTAFQTAAKLGNEIIEIPLPRSMIPKASNIGTGLPYHGKSLVANRGDYVCKDLSLTMDKYGYCCEIEQMKDPTTDLYPGSAADPEKHICTPIRALDPSVIKDNMSNNAEFVARLDAAMRYRLTSLATLERCVSAANSIPDDYNYNILQAQDQVKQDKVLGTKVSLIQLKKAIDPMGDFRLVKHMTKELDEWIEMFLSPCYGALYGTNVGFSPDLDVTYFMAYPWYKHKECMHLTCLTNSMRWDQENGGCVPSVIVGATSKEYNDDDTKNEHCAKDGDCDQLCKHDTKTMKQFQDDQKNCVGSIGMGNLDYLLSQFCLPQVTGEILSDGQKNALNEKLGGCDHQTTQAVNPDQATKNTKCLIACQGGTVIGGQCTCPFGHDLIDDECIAAPSSQPSEQPSTEPSLQPSLQPSKPAQT